MSYGSSARATSLRHEILVSSDGRGGLGAAGRGLEIAPESSAGVMKIGVDEPRHDELEAQEEADVVKPLPTPDMPTRSEFLTTASRTRRTGRGADIVEKDEAESSAIDPNTEDYERSPLRR